jgi:hypothetical protein
MGSSVVKGKKSIIIFFPGPKSPGISETSFLARNQCFQHSTMSHAAQELPPKVLGREHRRTSSPRRPYQDLQEAISGALYGW